MSEPNPSGLVLRRIVADLPLGFERLRAEAAVEGVAHVERLAVDWASGALRFTADGEILFAAELGGELAGVGGATIEPAVPNSLRLRRFYVRPAFRKAGAGRALAAEVIRHAEKLGRDLTLNALTPQARAFWERLGFSPDGRGLGFTHWMAHRGRGGVD